MTEEQFPLAECCVKCPHFDEFGRSCTHSLRQAIIKELSTEQRDDCSVFQEIRAQSMRELEREYVS